MIYQEGVAETLEELWLSYNLVEKLKGIQVLKRLKVLYLGNNLIKEWAEFNRLQELTTLETLVFVGNPLMEATVSGDETAWRSECARRLPNLKKLDGETIVAEMVEQLQPAPAGGAASSPIAAASGAPAAVVA